MTCHAVLQLSGMTDLTSLLNPIDNLIVGSRDRNRFLWTRKNCEPAPSSLRSVRLAKTFNAGSTLNLQWVCFRSVEIPRLWSSSG